MASRGLPCASSSSGFISMGAFFSERKGGDGVGEDPVRAFCSVGGLKAGSFCCVPN